MKRGSSAGRRGGRGVPFLQLLGQEHAHLVTERGFLADGGRDGSNRRLGSVDDERFHSLRLRRARHACGFMSSYLLESAQTPTRNQQHSWYKKNVAGAACMRPNRNLKYSVYAFRSNHREEQDVVNVEFRTTRPGKNAPGGVTI